MNNDELATRRAQAIAEDRCFSKGRLRDEFRMKPAPGAEPVKWYKNTYGGRFAVYRIADCVPMREKRPLTSKQQLAGQRLPFYPDLTAPVAGWHGRHMTG